MKLIIISIAVLLAPVLLIILATMLLLVPGSRTHKNCLPWFIDYIDGSVL